MNKGLTLYRLTLLVLCSLALSDVGCDDPVREDFIHDTICFTALAPCPSRTDAYRAICSLDNDMTSVDSEPREKAPPDEDGTQSCCYEYTQWFSVSDAPPPTGQTCSTVLGTDQPSP